MILKENLYKDSLTGMLNFFGFIESDFNEVFADNGAVLIIDIANFLKFNEKFGRANGDICLQELSKSIRKVISNLTNVSVFRTGGDEFTIIFPEVLSSNVDVISNSIRLEFTEVMQLYDFNDIELHKFIFSYNSGISNIQDYYRLFYSISSNQVDSSNGKFQGYRLMIHIMNEVLGKVKDTLSHYNNAFELALTDDISGLKNHRAGSAYLVYLLEKCELKKLEFSILFIDGDSLRRYNEISYETGNEMIRKLSEIISSSKRKVDKVYRWISGDEFLVILEDTDSNSALKLADRIRKDVEEQTKDLVYPLTVSIGVASYPEDGNSIEDILDSSEKDNALAKSLGKNRVEKRHVSLQ